MRFRFLLVTLLVAVGMLATALIGGQSSASAQGDEEQAFIEAINRVRADAGLPTLIPHTELTGLSREWAKVMADAGDIFHADPISRGLTAPWSKLGENVGVGGDVAALMDAFVASPGHYANIVDPAFTHVGVGVVRVGDTMYTTHRFLQEPANAPSTSTPPETPAPPATTAPPETTAPPATTAPPTTTPPQTTLPPEEVTVPVPGASPERIVANLALLDQIAR